MANLLFSDDVETAIAQQALVKKINDFNKRFEAYAAKYEGSLPKAQDSQSFNLREVELKERRAFSEDSLVSFMKHGGADALKALSVNGRAATQDSNPLIRLLEKTGCDRVHGESEGYNIYEGGLTSHRSYELNVRGDVSSRMEVTGRVLAKLEGHLASREAKLEERLKKGNGTQRVQDLPHGRVAMAQDALAEVPYIYTGGDRPRFPGDSPKDNHLREISAARPVLKGMHEDSISEFEAGVARYARLVKAKMDGGHVVTHETMDGLPKTLDGARESATAVLAGAAADMATLPAYFRAARALDNPDARAHALMGGRLTVAGVDGAEEANALLASVSDAAGSMVSKFKAGLPAGQHKALIGHYHALSEIDAAAVAPLHEVTGLNTLRDKLTQGQVTTLDGLEASPVPAMTAQKTAARHLKELSTQEREFLKLLAKANEEMFSPKGTEKPQVHNQVLAIASLHQWKKDGYSKPLDGIVDTLAVKIPEADAAHVKTLLTQNGHAANITRLKSSLRQENLPTTDINTVTNDLSFGIVEVVRKNSSSPVIRFLEQLDKRAVEPTERSKRATAPAERG